MKNKFKGLSDSRKLEMLSLTVEEIYNLGFECGESLRPFAKFVAKASSGTVEQTKPLTPNQQRAAVIKQAREFVEFKKRFLVNSEEIEGGYEEKKIENPRFFNDVAEVEFIVNDEKRTIVAILRGFKTGRFISKGIAKCMLGDVFNEDIGKAITLAKALEIEVPKEFTHAVQPTEKVVGMQVYDAQKRVRSKYNTVVSDAEWAGEGFCCVSSASSRRATILDDTDAQYEVSP